MTIEEILTQRRDGKLTDVQAIAALQEAGQTEAQAREWLRRQDAAFTDDVIEED